MSGGDIAWVLASAALVLFMIPGLALFYGGMVRSKNVLSMLVMNMYCAGIVPIVWALVGWSLAAGASGHALDRFIGNWDFVFLRDVDGDAVTTWVFLAMFAAITPALISGAAADRMKFAAWAVFVPVWSLLVYAPVVYWIYAPKGWIANLPAHDFAGGTAIHVNAGAAALALVTVLGRRTGWPHATGRPHNLVLTMLGAGILWFGWFGFNAGSALGATPLAAQAFMNTFLAAAAGMVAWMLIETIRDGRPTSLGVASGLVAALVAITPAAGFVGGLHSFVFGACAGVVCYFAIHLKYRLGYDDSLDVVGVHMIGGLVGGLLIGFLADSSAVPGGDFLDGLFFGGGIELLFNQIVSMVVVLAYSFGVTFAIAKVLAATMGLRVTEEAEREGLDLSLHGEIGYSYDA
jgi:ammonium transporter, Amt family